jgi:hypothetical protein
MSATVDIASPEVAELLANLDDPMWRICSGKLYKIIVKGSDDDDDGLVVPFVPNRAQRRLIARLHNRNLILKARQLGFTTLACILWLDTALFAKSPIRCGIIAQDKEAAEVIFRDKVKFGYRNLPPMLLEMFPLARDSANELLFAHNGASIRVATSMRSGTIHRLHISEYGKICAKYPDKAQEVKTGSLPAVPTSGIVIIESTAEGREGDFFDKTERAKALAEKRAALGPKDFRFHFFPWWEAPEYELDPSNVHFTEADNRYFFEVEAKIKRKISPAKRAWYVATREGDFGGEAPLMWQEYPSCVAGHVLVGTPNGIMPIRDVVADGTVIHAHMNKGVRPVFEVRTRLGYTVTCTDDHPIKTPSGGFRKICEGLAVGDHVKLSPPALSGSVQHIEWSPAPFVDGRIHITPEFAEFLGVFMGDGSFYNGSVSVACDRQDEDMVVAVTAMFNRFLGGSATRVVGNKQGCIEVRKSSIGFAEPMLALGIVESRNNGGLKRKVHVPAYILKSPREVVAAFLRGLFEADGFAARDGTSIKFFSKHQHVVQDVQLLLLALGIESRVSSQNKISGAGNEYIGWELVLRADGVRKFAAEVGFISKRKQDRANLSLSKRKTGCNTNFDWSDEIVSIAPAGEAEVFDITTATHEFDAGGIVVHNCPEEAFQVSTEGCYFAEQLARARKQDRILPRLPVEAAPVNTFWDIGRGDMTAIWFHQRIGPHNRFIRYYEESGEDLDHYAEYLQKTGYTFGKHYLPHEAAYRRIGQNKDTNRTIEEMLQDLLSGHRFEVVPRVTAINTGITATRNVFSSCYFDETGCDKGLKRLAGYRKAWDKTRGCWKDEPLHDDNSHGADAFRQFGQEADNGNTFPGSGMSPSSGGSKAGRRRTSGMAA